MDTGEAAPTWLDSRLNGDDDWADGVGTDAPSWVSAAFSELETMTPLQVAAEADSLDASGRATSSLFDSAEDVDAEAIGSGDALDHWLKSHADFEQGGADIAFEVTDEDVGEFDGAPLAVPALRDPFDEPLADTELTAPPDGGPGDGLKTDEALLVDDIAPAPSTAPSAVQAMLSEPGGPPQHDEVPGMPTGPAADSGGDLLSFDDLVLSGAIDNLEVDSFVDRTDVTPEPEAATDLDDHAGNQANDDLDGWADD